MDLSREDSAWFGGNPRRRDPDAAFLVVVTKITREEYVTIEVKAKAIEVKVFRQR